jgi:putative transposase
MPWASASTIGRLKEVWQEEHAQWQKRDLSAKRYVYVWADGIYLEALVEAAQRAWRRLDGCNQLSKVILGVKFADGLEVANKPTTVRQSATAAG